MECFDDVFFMTLKMLNKLFNVNISYVLYSTILSYIYIYKWILNLYLYMLNILLHKKAQKLINEIIFYGKLSSRRKYWWCSLESCI